MDTKAVQGYLVGYDGDERYRIYVRNGSKVILSRDVQFQEIPGSCIENVKLPLSLSGEQNSKLSEDVDTEELITEDQEEFSDQYGTVGESENDDGEEEVKVSSDRLLRDRS